MSGERGQRISAEVAYFDHQAIQFELFHAGLRNDLPDWLVAVRDVAGVFESLLQVLVTSCFWDVNSTTQTYRIHMPVHDWTFTKLNKTINSRS